MDREVEKLAMERWMRQMTDTWNEQNQEEELDDRLDLLVRESKISDIYAKLREKNPTMDKDELFELAEMQYNLGVTNG